MRSSPVLAVLLALAPAVPLAPGQGGQRDPGGIEGTWELLSSVYGGELSLPEGRRTWTITRTRIRYSDAIEDAYAIDPKANPEQITVTQIRPGNGAADGAKLWGIYEVKGDTLRICVAPADRGRPRAFESAAGSQQNLHTLRRVARALR